MADARKFVLPGQPPGTSRRRPSPLLPGLGWFFSLFPRAREHGEFDGFFFFLFWQFGLLRLRMRFRLKMERRREKKKNFTCCVDRRQVVLNGVVHLKKGRASVLGVCSCSPREIPRSFFFLFLKKEEFRSISGLCKILLYGLVEFLAGSVSLSLSSATYLLSFFPPERKRLASLWRFADFSGQ